MLRLYNTLTRQVEPIRPLRPGQVTMYSCGPTVYRPVHIGNLRSFLLADRIRRALAWEGVALTQVMAGRRPRAPAGREGGSGAGLGLGSRPRRGRRGRRRRELAGLGVEVTDTREGTR